MNFRKTQEQDIELIMETEVRYKDFVAQWSYEQHKAALFDSNILHIIFYDVVSDYLGYAILRGINNRNHCMELVRIAVNKPNLGHGKKALNAVLNHCFDNLSAHRIWLDVREHNQRAQFVYEQCGFVKEGLLRESVLIEDKYYSKYIMSILDKDFKEINK